jgi:hypothetical protein
MVPNSTQMHPSNADEFQIGRFGSNLRLVGNEREGLVKRISERAGSRGPVLEPPLRGLADLGCRAPSNLDE